MDYWPDFSAVMFKLVVIVIRLECRARIPFAKQNFGKCVPKLQFGNEILGALFALIAWLSKNHNTIGGLSCATSHKSS